jgi:hypothetical protein
MGKHNNAPMVKGPTPRITDDGNLQCPHCGHDHIGHFEVNVFWRKEDSPTGTRVRSTSDSTTIDGCIFDNPSYRRSGLSVLFVCEGCHKKSVLSISQHKGVSQIIHD